MLPELLPKRKTPSVQKQLHRSDTEPRYQYKYTQNLTIAEVNHVSIKEEDIDLSLDRPLRIPLPRYFNVPRFTDIHDKQDDLAIRSSVHSSMHPSSAGIRLKLEDLSLLSQGMKRAKNIKEESRCYYTQAAFLHNCCCFEESITCLEKFLKIVLFIKDHKSVELGLNAIGIGYWCLKDYAKALAYFSKHTERAIGDNSREKESVFIARINVAMCHERLKQQSEAEAIYASLHEEASNEGDMRKSEAVEVSKETAKLREKQKYLEKQLIRIREKKKGKRERKFKNSFVAEGIHNSTPKLAKDKSSQRKLKKISPLKEKYYKQKRMKNTPNGSLSETSKLTDAILSADEHINGYLTMLQETYSGEIRQHCK